MKKIIFFALLLALSPCLAAAKDITVDDITAKMEAADKNVNSLEFDFKQEIIYNLTNEKQTNSGHVAYMKPENIYVKQHSPLDQEIVSNGKRVWIYTPKYHQVIVDNWKKWASNSFVPVSIINFGKGWKDLKKKYAITYEGIDDNKYVLLFKPAGEEAIKMKFWVSADDFVPVKVVLTGENVTINTEMINKSLNPKLDKKLFIFQAPSGVDVMNLP